MLLYALFTLCECIGYLLSTGLAQVKPVTGSMRLSFRFFTVPLFGSRNLIQNRVREQDVCSLRCAPDLSFIFLSFLYRNAPWFNNAGGKIIGTALQVLFYLGKHFPHTFYNSANGQVVRKSQTEIKKKHKKYKNVKVYLHISTYLKCHHLQMRLCNFREMILGRETFTIC